METQLQLLSGVASFFFIASLKTTVLLALVLLARRLFGRVLSASSRYLLWWAVVISLVVPIGFNIPLPVTERTASLVVDGITTSGVQPTPDPGVMQWEVSEESLLMNDAGDRVQDARKALPVRSLLSLLWLAGVVGVLGSMIVASIRFSVLLPGSASASLSLEKLFQDCCEGVACRTRVRLLVSDQVQLPSLTGFFRPALLWPAGLETQLSTEQLRHVFLHELMHVKRMDIPGACLVALVQALHWFNPAVWIAFSYMRQDRELACDATTLELLGKTEARAYAQTLIHLGAFIPQTAKPRSGLGILDEHRHLRQRILMLLKNRPSLVLQSVLAAVVFLPSAFIAFGQPARDVRVEELVAEPVADSALLSPSAPVETVAELVVIPSPAAETEVRQAMPPDDLSVIPVELMTSDTPANVPSATAVAAMVETVPEVEQLMTDAGEAEFIAAAVPAMDSSLLLAAISTTSEAEDNTSYESSDGGQTTEELSQSEGERAAGEELTCLNINFGNFRKPRIQRICDTLVQWTRFEQGSGLEPGSVARLAAAAEPDQVFAVSIPVCRLESASMGMIKKYSCRNASEWSAVDGNRNMQAQLWTRGFQNTSYPTDARLSSGPPRP